MEKYLTNFFEEFDYPMDARDVFLNTYRIVNSDDVARDIWNDMISAFILDEQCDFYSQLKWCTLFAGRALVSEFTLHLLLFICHSKQLRVAYAKKGIEDRFWSDTVGELKAKLFECYKVYGVWGTFAPTAFNRTFHMRSFVLGRLRFDPDTFGRIYDKNGIVFNEESTVIMVHIPRTGTPLTPSACEASYREAIAFFTPILGGSPCLFVCQSWLLFPENRNMLSEKSNIRAFMDTYDLIDFGYYERNNPDLWRLFDTMEQNPNRLPADTSLRRAYIDLLQHGGKTGWGLGAYYPNFH